MQLEQTLTTNWKFHLGDQPEAWRKDFDDATWRSVTLPHDWAVEGDFSPTHSSGTGYLPGGIGWYRCRFCLPQSAAGKQIALHFDGVYKNSQVYCNGYYLGMRPNGYVGFSYDISHCAVFGEGENVISVCVRHEDIADSRWYTGSGITRLVHVTATEPIRFAPDSLFVFTEQIGKTATLRINCTLQNALPTAEPATATFALLCADGTQVALHTEAVCLPQTSATSCNIALTVPAPMLWSPASPDLYTLVASIAQANGASHTLRIPVGIRSARFDPDEGFFLNETPTKLKGVCLHHDGGCLGAALHKSVWRRRLEALKNMGCNAIRMSHNPHMPALYDLCDEMGFLVIDEAFDEWEGCKNKWSHGHNVYPPVHQGYAQDFPNWWRADLQALILRDRNHPSVIAWSIGNEVDYPNDPYCHPSFQTMTGNNDANKPAAERQFNPANPNMERLSTLAAMLAQEVKTLDASRPVTAAVAFPELSSYLGFLDPLDVVGYNYKEEFYASDHKRFAQKPFLGSENSHDYAAWLAARNNDYIAGQFLWTGADYLGEAKGWPVHGSPAGHLDLAGFAKENFWFRRALWADTPVCSLVAARKGGQFARDWCFAEGETVLVRCYTNQASAQLFLNETACQEKPLCPETGYIEWEIVFHSGTLCAKTAAVCDSLCTTGRAVSLALNLWQSQTAPQPEDDIFQVEILLLDAAGRPTQGEDFLTASVSGNATLLGLENGDLADPTPYSVPYRRAHNGRLLVYLRRTAAQSSATLMVSGAQLGSQSLVLPLG